MTALDPFIAKMTSGENAGRFVLKTNEYLRNHCSFDIGGPADVYVEPQDAESLGFIFNVLAPLGIRFIVIGRGSNLLFADEGFRGVVISTVRMTKISVDPNNGSLTADAGAALSSVAATAARSSLTGMEFAAGIPGSCGGAVFMNAGAYDCEIAQILTSSSYFALNTMSERTISVSEHDFGYRDSVYRTHPEWIILSARFQLSGGAEKDIRQKTEELLRKRREKQPLEYPSAGSAFKRYPGKYTAQLIDEAGLKGLTIGGAQVSEKHAGFIVNRGGATAKDVMELIWRIRSEVFSRNGIWIEPEIVFVPVKEEN